MKMDVFYCEESIPTYDDLPQPPVRALRLGVSSHSFQPSRDHVAHQHSCMASRDAAQYAPSRPKRLFDSDSPYFT